MNTLSYPTNKSETSTGVHRNACQMIICYYYLDAKHRNLTKLMSKTYGCLAANYVVDMQ